MNLPICWAYISKWNPWGKLRHLFEQMNVQTNEWKAIIMVNVRWSGIGAKLRWMNLKLQSRYTIRIFSDFIKNNKFHFIIIYETKIDPEKTQQKIWNVIIIPIMSCIHVIVHCSTEFSVFIKFLSQFLPFFLPSLCILHFYCTEW